MESLKLQFHYKKSTHFRVIHADGAWGGITPDLNVFMGLYSQRPPIPEMTVQPVMPDGTLGEEIQEAGISKKGLVREMEAGIVMSAATVEALIPWLTARLDVLRKVEAERHKQNDTAGRDIGV